MNPIREPANASRMLAPLLPGLRTSCMVPGAGQRQCRLTRGRVPVSSAWACSPVAGRMW